MGEGGKGDLQFERAEYPEAPSSACAACGQGLWDAYYQVNGRVTCERCKTQLELAQPNGSGFGRFVRASLFGALAGGVGAGIWYGVRAATGYEVGLIAIVVGLMVGGAVKAGARGRGGWLYQLVAVVLTYASIVSTYIPLIIQTVRQQKTAEAAAGAPAPSLLMLLVGLAALFALACALPFLMGFKNIIGLFIIGIGLWEAWKINRRVPFEIAGPFRVGAPAPPAPGG